MLENRYACWRVGAGDDEVRLPTNGNSCGEAATGDIEHRYLAVGERDETKLSVKGDGYRLWDAVQGNDLFGFLRKWGFVQQGGDHVYLVMLHVRDVYLFSSRVIVHRAKCSAQVYGVKNLVG